VAITASACQDRFLSALQKRGIPDHRRLEDGRFVVSVNGTDCTVSLDNVARIAMRDGDFGAIDQLVDRLFSIRLEPRSWQDAVLGLRLSVESSTVELGDAIQLPVGGHVVQVLALVDDEESQIAWVSPRQLEGWGVSERLALDAALANMNTLLEKTQLEIQEAAGCKLGMFLTSSPLKASLVLAPALREKVLDPIGWPVFAVIPCRDFLYVFRDEALIGRLGGVVVREFRESGYPISTEVFRISDEGIRAIGTFPV
jgi:hypothetical protein